MKLESLDWLDCSLFLLLASAEVTDHYITESEINTIIEKAEGLVATFDVDPTAYSNEVIRQKFNRAFEWYDQIGESAPKGHMNGHITSTIFEVAGHMKTQDWFSANFAHALLKNLVDLAAADGETIRNEQQLINKVAQQWGLRQPFA